jgi:hypothetical protein
MKPSRTVIELVERFRRPFDVPDDLRQWAATCGSDFRLAWRTAADDDVLVRLALDVMLRPGISDAPERARLWYHRFLDASGWEIAGVRMATRTICNTPDRDTFRALFDFEALANEAGL